MIPQATHLAARLEPEAARRLMENRRTDFLNAWRQYARSVSRKEAAEEVLGTANAMAQMVNLEGGK